MTMSLLAPRGDDLTRESDLGCNRPEVVFDEIIEEIRSAVVNQPRSLQTRIGPSEIGEPCERALITKLMGLPEPDEGVNFRAWVGTCMHVGFEDIMRRSPLQTAGDTPRYLLEAEVIVGVIGGVVITGHCDLFDTLSGTVVDHKSKSKTQLQRSRLHGAGPEYRAQAHLYGLGWVRAGYWVNTVMNIYYPRDGELRDACFWAEPYDESIALAALERANRLHALATMLGPEAAIALYPKCENEFCRICGNWRAPFNAPKEVQTTLSGLLAAT